MIDTTEKRDWDAVRRGFWAAKRGQDLNVRQSNDWQSGWHLYHSIRDVSVAAFRVGALH